MELSAKEKKILKNAYQLGYISSQQLTEICELRKGYPDVVQFLLQRGTLTAQQLQKINQIDTPAAKGTQSDKHTPSPSAVPFPGQQHIAPGQMFGDIQIIDEIGRGGMGIVYKGIVQSDSTLVAIKILLDPSTAQANCRRFLRESKTHRRLKHPHIVPLYSTGSKQQYPYLTMQYLSGGSFSQFLATDASLTAKVQKLVKICQALHYAHKKRIIHRDLKPSNILLDENGEPFISDFGLAKFLDSTSKLTQTGATVGTAFYMAPEQVTGKKVGPHSDIYSMGVILYQSITGKLPFIADMVGELYHKILHVPAVAPRSHNPQIPKDLEAICLKAMEKSPRLRYRSAGVLARDLERWLQGKKVQASRVNPLAILIRSYYRLVRRRWAVTIVILLMMVASICGLYQYRQNQDHVPTNSRRPKKEILLEIEQLEKNGRIEEMRFALTRLREFPLNAQELQKMGLKALFWGYFEDAHHYFFKALQQSKPSPPKNLHQYLANSLLFLGEHNKARRIYLQLYRQQQQPHPEVILGLATIAEREHRPQKALQYLRQLSSGSMAIDSYLQAQQYFLRAKILWQSVQHRLEHWQWLFPEQNEHPLYRELRQKLAKVQEYLQKCRQQLLLCDKNHLTKSLAQNCDSYIHALQLDMGQSTIEKAQQLCQDLRKCNLSTPATIFFYKVVLRFLIRHKQWQPASEICWYVIRQYPCVASFYHLRGLIQFHRGAIDKSLDSIYHVLKLDRLNFIPIENINLLMFQRMTYREVKGFFRLMKSFAYGNLSPLPTVILQKFATELRERNLYRRQYVPLSSKDNEWRPLLQNFLQSTSASVSQLAMNMLARHHANSELQQHLNALLSQASLQQKQRIRKLQKWMAQCKKNEKLQLLRQVLLNYASLADSSYVKQVHRLGKERLPLLLEIVRDSQCAPLLRFTAGRMLLALTSTAGHKTLRKMSRQKQFPQNLLAYAAIKLSGLAISPPNENICSAVAKPTRDRFCKVLLAMTLDPRHAPEVLQYLLHGNEEIVALCAAYNFQCYRTLLAKSYAANIDKRLRQLMASPAPYIRTLSCRVFWNFSLIGKPIPKLQKNTVIDNLTCKQLRKYSEDLLAILQDPVLEVQLEGIFSLILYDSPLADSINQIPDFKPLGQKIQRLLYHLYEKSNYIAKYWSAVALSYMDTNQQIWKIIGDPNIPFFIRMSSAISACAVNAAGEKLAAFKMWNLLQTLLNSAPRSDSDRAFKKLGIILLALYQKDFPWSGNLLKQQLRTILKSPDTEFKSTALIAMLYGKDISNLKRAKHYINAKNPHLRLAAITSITGLASAKQAFRFLQHKKSFSIQERQAAADGYYHVIYQEMVEVISEKIWHRKSYEAAYDFYLQGFRLRLQEISSSKLERWAKALKNAGAVCAASRYYLEAALVAFEQQQVPMAHRYLDIAIKLAQQEYANRQLNYQAMRCYLIRGEFYRHQQLLLKACNSFKKSLHEFPFHERAHLHLAEIYEQQAKIAKSCHHFFQAYLANRTNSRFLFRIAQGYNRQNRKQAAIHVLQQIHELSPLSRRAIIAKKDLANLKKHPWVLSLSR